MMIISKNIIHCVSKNVPPLTCYNLDTHDPITIIFGRNVTENVRNQMVLLNALITSFRESCSRVSMIHESERLKKSSSDWLNSGNALRQHLSEKCNFPVSLFCQLVQKHKLFEMA